MSRLSTLFIFTLIFLQMSCKKGPTEFEFKNPREYTWTIDTVAYPGSMQTFMQSIWGSSPKDVYMAGHNSSAFGNVYHYDGSSWQAVSTPFKILSLSSVFGFGRDDVWAVGDKSAYPDPVHPAVVIRYNGTNWYEVPVGNVPYLECVWGSSSSDVWMGGWDGVLLHYDGNSVSADSVPMFIAKNASPTWGFYTGASLSANEAYVILSAVPIAGQGYWGYTFKHQDDKWALVDSVNPLTIGSLWASPWGKLYRAASGVDVLQGGKWNKLFYAPSLFGVWGASENNLFAVGASRRDEPTGDIYHWDGNDAYLFENLPTKGTVFERVWTDGSEVFVVGTDGLSKTYVFHGR
jgi:hypothetical protein